jgi:hypothetical protein
MSNAGRELRGLEYIHAEEVLLDRICTDTMDVFCFLLERGAGFDWT